jgi:ABC-type glutathione transport system ATPase component
MPEPIFRIASLRRKFGGNPVVDDLSLRIHAGECRGVIGQNGAGKTLGARGIRHRRPLPGTGAHPQALLQVTPEPKVAATVCDSSNQMTCGVTARCQARE